MEILIAFLVNAYYIIGSMIIVLFAMKYALEQMRGGLDLVKAISRVLGFIVFFLALVFVLPALFEFGINKTITRMQNSTTSKNIIALVEDGTKLLAQERVNLSRVETDDTTLKDEATELYSDVQSNVQSNSSGVPSSGSQSSTNNTVAMPEREDGAVPIEHAPVQFTTPSYSLDTRANPVPTMTTLERIQANVQGGGTNYLNALEKANNEAVNDEGGGGPQTYIVKSGDSLSKIAIKFGVTTDALCKANNLGNCNVIAKGKKLVIP